MPINPMDGLARLTCTNALIETQIKQSHLSDTRLLVGKQQGCIVTACF